MGLYLLLIGVVASGVFHYLKNIKIEVSRNGIVIEKNGESLLPQREEPDIEEHLKIDNTPSGDNQTNQGGKLSVKEIAKKVRASVVGVIGEGRANFSNTSVGSGIIMRTGTSSLTQLSGNDENIGYYGRRQVQRVCCGRTHGPTLPY